MAGRGPAPKEQRANKYDVPQRGEWKAAPGFGWQHGEIPKPPAKLTKASRDAWQAWFRSWFAAFWSAEDVFALRQVIRLFDRSERGDASANDLSQLRQLLDTYGITPKGQQDRRWKPPKSDEQDEAVHDPAEDDLYGGLTVVEGGG